MNEIKTKLEALKDAKYKLLLIIGEPGTGKSKLINDYSAETGVPILELNKIFGESVPEGSDSQYITTFMNGYLAAYKPEVLLLDNKRVLYSQNSKIDLLTFLKSMAEKKTVIATWNGRVEDGKLIHIRSKMDEDLVYPVESLECECIICK